jgi:predicted nuclease with RNAse H fold
VLSERFRRTETKDNKTAKSVFQIGGAGAVGTGSIRGMPHLHALSDHGFGIWPFDSAKSPLVIEIYPRALTGAVTKGRWAERHDLLRRRFASQPPEMLERAAGSEDAFDAAVSALVMAEYQDQIAALTTTTDDAVAIEGKVWTPG